MEREVWIESFLKIVESNESGGVNNFNLKKTGDLYLRSLDNAEAVIHSIHMDTTKKKEIRATLDGVKTYKTQYLTITTTFIRGSVYKAIENVSFFHSGQYHERFFTLEFGHSDCFFFQKKDDYPNGGYHSRHK